MLIENDRLTQKEIAEALGLSYYTIREYFEKLKTENKVEHIGSRKDGYWKVNK